MDNHSTTRVDPRVVDAMGPLWDRNYGNAGSTSHSFGWGAKDALDEARSTVAGAINANDREIVFTSGATESNNLALRGLAELPRRTRSQIISVTTEHKAILDPLKKLGRRGFRITLLEPKPNGHAHAGAVEVDQIADAITDETLLVSIMMANNEIGTLQPLGEIGQLCRRREVLLHCDATQAVGKLPVDVQTLDIDLMSFSAHKLYGPKGVGALYVRRKDPRVRLSAQIDGGGQENGMRSGTLNVAGIVGFAKALELCLAELPHEPERLRELRDRLFAGLEENLSDVTLNGPSLTDPGLRLAGNLNCSFGFVDGEALMMSMRELAVSSGSACTSANPAPSHVLRAIGLSDDQTRASLRFGLGRFNTLEEVEFAIETVTRSVQRLRSLSSMA